MNIVNLPDLCQLTILDFIPINDVFKNVSLVCSKLCSFQVATLSRRRSLALLLGDLSSYILEDDNDGFNFAANDLRKHSEGHKLHFYQPRNKLSVVKFDKLTRNISQRLVDTFQNVTNLVIVLGLEHGDDLATQQEIVFLLERWAQKLVKLSIHIVPTRSWHVAFKPLSQPKQTKLLIDAINSLPKLRSLTLQLDCSDQMAQFALPILVQLREFNICAYGADYHLHSILDSLSRHAHSNHLTQIGIEDTFQCFQTLQRFIKLLDQKTTSKFTHLNLGFELERTTLECIIAHFPSLTTLSVKLNFDKISLAQLVNSLGKLEQLRHLELKGCFNDSSSFRAFDQIPQSDYQQLTSIKAVTLDLMIEQRHSNAQSNHFGHIFPNVSTLQVYYRCFSCSECSLTSVKNNSAKCARKMLSLWKQCASLQQIYLKCLNQNFVQELTRNEL